MKRSKTPLLYNIHMITLALFFLWRLLDFAVAAFAGRFIPYLGFFPYKEILADYRLPAFLNALAGFDGVQYLTLVREGYNTYTQAYFPLYFLLVRAVSFLFPLFQAARPRNELLAAIFVSNTSFLGGLYFFRGYLTALFPKNRQAVLWSLVLLLLFPTSFFFGAVYTEGLFFLLFAAALYFYKKENYPAAIIAAALSSAARLMGVFLFIPILTDLVFRVRAGKPAGGWRIAAVLAPFAGFAAYAAYLWASVGDPLFFFHAQPAFGAHRSTSLVTLPQVYYRYLKIFLTAAPNFQYFVSFIEFMVFSMVLAVLVTDLLRLMRRGKMNPDRLGLNLFSLLNIILPTATGTFSSVPRYALFSVSFFLFIAETKNTALRAVAALIFLAFHLVLLGFFAQGYFVG